MRPLSLRKRVGVRVMRQRRLPRLNNRIRATPQAYAAGRPATPALPSVPTPLALPPVSCRHDERTRAQPQARQPERPQAADSFSSFFRHRIPCLERTLSDIDSKIRSIPWRPRGGNGFRRRGGDQRPFWGRRGKARKAMPPHAHRHTLRPPAIVVPAQAGTSTPPASTAASDPTPQAKATLPPGRLVSHTPSTALVSYLGLVPRTPLRGLCFLPATENSNPRLANECKAGPGLPWALKRDKAKLRRFLRGSSPVAGPRRPRHRRAGKNAKSNAIQINSLRHCPLALEEGSAVKASAVDTALQGVVSSPQVPVRHPCLALPRVFASEEVT